jgi:hypothetical protein
VKLKLLLCLSGVFVLASPLAATAGSQTDRATGGGQVLVGTDGGAGDTIAFTARGTAEPGGARGQVQYVDRTGGTGIGQTVRHGTVSCLRVDGNTAKIAGTWDQGGTFQLLVVDNGQGAAADDDLVTVQNAADPTCNQEDNDDDNQVALARGNAQVYDASAGGGSSTTRHRNR